MLCQITVDSFTGLSEGPAILERTICAKKPAEAFDAYSPIHISKMVLPTVNLGPPTCMVDRTVFELWLGGL